MHRPLGSGSVAVIVYRSQTEPVVDEGRLALHDQQRVAAGLPAEGDEHAFGLAVRVVDLGDDGERPVLDVDDHVLREPDGARAVAGDVAGDEFWPLGGQQFTHVIDHRIDVVRAGLAVEQCLQFLELVRVAGRQVVGVAEI